MSEGEREVWLVANGDLRLSANRACWPEQERMEAALTEALRRGGARVVRAHPFDPAAGHGFIDSQKMGVEVFSRIPPGVPLVVAEAVWQYSQHVLPGLYRHRGPILTVANWSGRWPGLVGMLNLNGSLAKMGVAYSTLWGEDFADPRFQASLEEWLRDSVLVHDQSHVRDCRLLRLPGEEARLGQAEARAFRDSCPLMGVFDEGCMGMHNAIVPDELLHPLGVFKERLSQSALYAETMETDPGEGERILQWLLDRGVDFRFGTDEATELTRAQALLQCRMYAAALRIADRFGCAAIGIQYQQGLKDLLPASDLAEGMLNNADRPPVLGEGGPLYEGEPLPHFNEVDECSGLDALATHRLWRRLGYSPETTLHDLRWGRPYRGGDVDAFVWVFLISGAAPPAHFVGGWRGASSERQPPMYFRLGGGTLKGVSRPGHVVWSRVFVMEGRLHCDLGVARVVALPEEETRARWEATTPQWPIMHAVIEGATRDQMMARHKSNHIQVAYAPSRDQAHSACRVKAAMLSELGIETHLCGAVELG